MALREDEVFVSVQVQWMVAIVKVRDHKIDSLDARGLDDKFARDIERCMVDKDAIAVLCSIECLILISQSVNGAMEAW